MNTKLTSLSQELTDLSNNANTMVATMQAHQGDWQDWFNLTFRLSRLASEIARQAGAGSPARQLLDAIRAIVPPDRNILAEEIVQQLGAVGEHNDPLIEYHVFVSRFHNGDVVDNKLYTGAADKVLADIRADYP